MELSDDALALWGKKSNRDGDPRWLPLVAHLVDTKNVGYWLYTHWLSDGDRNFLTQRIASEMVKAGLSPVKAQEQAEREMGKLIKFLCYIHDIGKATPAFQVKRSYNHDDQLDEILVDRLMHHSFKGLADATLSSPAKSPHARAGEAILQDAGLNETVAAIIGGHHGKPQSKSPIDQLVDYTSNYYQSDNDEQAKAPWKKAQGELIRYGRELAGYKDIKDVPPVTQAEAVILEGLLIMSDWLASSEYLNDNVDYPMFTLIGLDEGFDSLDMDKRWQSAIKTWKLNDQWEPDEVNDAKRYYQDHFGFAPRQIQEVMADKLLEANDPGLMIVEAPMGIGKTEIALAAAEQLASATGRSGVYVGLPTQATSNAMFRRVEDWARKMAQGNELNFSMELLHGKAYLNSDFTDLPRAEDVDLDDEDSSGIQEGAISVNSWFSGKKSILADFEVGTIDNLLLMGLKQKHLFLRHLGFSNKVIILDEVHAYDAYMNSYLYKALEWLGAYHVPVIILSATLPKEKRNEIIGTYFKGKYHSSFEQNLIAADGWEDNYAYPLLSILDGQELKQISNFGQKLPSHELQIEYLDEDPNVVMAKVEAKIANGGVAGIIVNTVKRAQEFAKLVPKGVGYLVLHSAFLATDRMNKEEKLQDLIGKNGQRPKKYIVIGTQVLEQSLDIDFDVLFTDIAPMDLLLQRAGRLHRHEIDRPEGLEESVLYVLKPEGDGYGDANEAIYEKYYLQKTEAFLPRVVKLPDDISILVQKVYDPPTDDQVENLQDAKEDSDKHFAKENSKAESFQVSDPKYPKKETDLQNKRKLRKLTLHGWLDWDAGNLDENQAIAAVRDIRESVEVILLKEVDSKYYLLDEGKETVAVDEIGDRDLAQEIIRLPGVLTLDVDKAIKTLETITIKRFPEWQNSPWLKGSIALVLDENNETTFAGYRLKYLPAIGLTHEKEEGEK